MRSIIIFRHGKSDWDAVYDRDHNRPLSKRGLRASKKMGQYLNKIKQIPEIVISSSAIRAKSTAKLALEHGSWSSELAIETKIYGGTPETLLNIISKFSGWHGRRVLERHRDSVCKYGLGRRE